ncbi:hypothetical protein KZZ52_46785 [Dactylosporangium sp. AC04546]|uniref:hypothetical protein n=1 Tax=Dactylosporangium sp. AC04546 TaxID=2862460 RepID=UPI001EDD48A0|nr:hypothetical protein [Dactylosporangium sp. AC04546]WVK81420.1 hypothetical protein KZZ52_46785 [Dactylosporangium sp. AC04546]
MAQDKHVTSAAIRQLGKDLVEDAGVAYDPLMREVAAAKVDPPGFGMLGFMLQQAFDEAKQYAVDYAQAGKDQLGAYRTALDGIAGQWEQAETANQVMYR